MGKKIEMSQGLKDRLERNRRIFEITLDELEQKKSIGELSYPESVEINIRFKINYRESIRNIKDSLKRIKKILGLSSAKDSGLIRERKALLKEHLAILRVLRKKNKLNQEGLKVTAKPSA